MWCIHTGKVTKESQYTQECAVDVHIGRHSYLLALRYIF